MTNAMSLHAVRLAGTLLGHGVGVNAPFSQGASKRNNFDKYETPHVDLASHTFRLCEMTHDQSQRGASTYVKFWTKR